jgi:peptidoglycan hydrolase CwlO-like protein
MSAVFEAANTSLAGIFESLQREIARIDNLDAAARSKQQHVDNLTAQENELAVRVKAAQATLDELHNATAAKVEQHEKAKHDLDALRAAARRVAAG